MPARARAAAPDPPDPDELQTVRGASHAGARPANLALHDTVFASCDLATVVAHRAQLTRVRAQDCRMTGLSLPGATLRDVTVTGCRVDLAAFEAATLERVRFEDCVLRETSFRDARLHSVAFDGCDLGGADLSGIVTSRVELTGCRIAGLKGLERLRGVQMRFDDILENAVLFAAALGIAVLEEE